MACLLNHDRGTGLGMPRNSSFKKKYFVLSISKIQVSLLGIKTKLPEMGNKSSEKSFQPESLIISVSFNA